MTGRRIAVIGSNNHDLVTYVTRMPVPGETVEAPGFEMGFGGKGANQAMAAARLGARVTMVTCVGDDMFGTATLANFAQNGIDATHCRVVPGTPSGVAPIFVEPSGENAILIVKGANAALSPADIDAAADDLAGCGLTRAARYAADSITRRGAQKSYASAADFARFEAEHEARP